MSKRHNDIKHRVWALCHPRKIANAKLRLKPGAVIENGYGEQFEIVKCGFNGCEIKSTNTDRPTSFFALLTGGGTMYAPWTCLAWHYRIISSASDSVEQAMAGGLKQ